MPRHHLTFSSGEHHLDGWIMSPGMHAPSPALVMIPGSRPSDVHAWKDDELRTRLQEAGVDAAKSIKSHWDGVVSYFVSGVTNAVLESANASFQAARAKARGYRNPAYAICILYLIAGGLNIPDLNKTHSK